MVPLDGILSLQCVDCTTQLGVIGNLAEDRISLSMSPPKMLNICKNVKEVKCKIVQKLQQQFMQHETQAPNMHKCFRQKFKRGHWL